MAKANYLHYNVMLLKICGLYKFKTRFLSILILIIFSSTTYLGIIERGVMQFSTNGRGYGCLCGILCALQRFIYYCLHDDELKKLLVKMNETFKGETKTLLQERNIKNCLGFINKLTFTWLIYAELFILMFCLYPVFTNLHKDRALPLALSVPYDYDSSPSYELTYFLQTACFLITTFLQTSMDMFFVSVVLLTAEQFKLLGWEFKNLLFTKLVENGVPKEIVSKFRAEFNGVSLNAHRELEDNDVRLIYDLCCSEEFNEDVLRSLNNLIKFHQSLLLFCADLENFFSPMLLVFYSFLMSTALFLNVAVITTKDTTILLQCLPINLAVYFDIFVPCCFVNVLTKQAEKLREDLYELPWYIFNKKFKINFLFLLHKMNAPIGITLGKLSVLGFPFFLWAVRTINSYCLVLNQLYQSKLDV